MPNVVGSTWTKCTLSTKMLPLCIISMVAKHSRTLRIGKLAQLLVRHGSIETSSMCSADSRMMMATARGCARTAAGSTSCAAVELIAMTTRARDTGSLATRARSRRRHPTSCRFPDDGTSRSPTPEALSASSACSRRAQQDQSLIE